MAKCCMLRLDPFTGRLDKEGLAACVRAIEEGEVIIFPTDTVYGLACNAFHPGAVKKVYSLKGRSYAKPLPVFVATAGEVHRVAEDIPKEAHHLMKAFWPGPLTLVFKTAPLALHATRGRRPIAVRVPDHGVVRQILKAVKLPLAVTSANPSGEPSATTFTQVRRAFEGRMGLIVDGGRCPGGVESSVVDASHYPFSLLREAAIPRGEFLKRLNLA